MFDTQDLPTGNVRDPGDFPQEQFVLIPDVPIFAEHETETKDGRQIKFGRRELEAVATRSNRRISDSGDYAALCIGHTPSPEAKGAGAPDPEVVGFAGPYRIGKIGQPGKQRYAILADFHVFREDVERFKKYPRRSPELWLEDRYEEMFLDPIALLGAEAPRLDLGLLYSAQRQGIQIEKYSAVAPGPMSTFVPNDDTRQYQAPSQQHEDTMTPEDLHQIVDALEQTDWVQWVRAQMAQAPDNPVGGDVSDAGGPPEPGLEPPVEPEGELGMEAPPEAPPVPPMDAPPEPPVEEPTGVPPVEEAPPVAEGDQPVEEDEGRHKMYAAMDEIDDDEFDHYCFQRKKAKYEAEAAGEYQTADQAEGVAGSKVEIQESVGPKNYMAEGSADADKDTPTEGTAQGSQNVAGGSADEEDSETSPRPASKYRREGEPERYRKMQEKLQSVEKQVGDLEERLKYERTARVDAERLQELTNLRFEGYAIEPEREIERLSYSKMDAEAFKDQVQFIVDHCQRVPLHELPYSPDSAKFAGDRPGNKKEQEKYSKSASDEALRLCQLKIEQGESPDYEAVLTSLRNGSPT